MGRGTIFSGGYPAIFDRRLNPADWLRSYVATYIERDVRMVSNVGDLTAFQRFVQLCAGRTAQLINYSQLADDCSISQPAWVPDECALHVRLTPRPEGGACIAQERRQGAKSRRWSRGGR